MSSGRVLDYALSDEKYAITTPFGELQLDFGKMPENVPDQLPGKIPTKVLEVAEGRLQVGRFQRQFWEGSGLVMSMFKRNSQLLALVVQCRVFNGF